MSSTSTTLHIIGAGMAGLAAAVAASAQGLHVVLYEAAPQAGGRCRSYYDKKLRTTIDNGNHLLMGANRAALAYLHHSGTLGLCVTDSTPRYPFIHLESRRHWHFAPPRFKGIPAAEWWHALKLVRPAPHKTVAQVIPPHTMLYQKLVEPFCLAALNTSPHEASAAMLAATLRHLVGGGRKAWQSYCPAASLSAVFVEPALARIKGRGCSIHYHCPVQAIEQQGERVTGLRTPQQHIRLGENDHVIAAVPPAVLATLLPDCVEEFTYSPIINGHFMWPQAGMFRQTMPFLGVVGGAVQWIFFHEGRLSTTTSAANDELMALDEATLAQRLWQDICRALYLDNVAIPPYRIIREKRATYAATPENLAKRPSCTTRWHNLFLAGDYVQSPHPATIEAAISSGYAAASLVATRIENHEKSNND